MSSRVSARQLNRTLLHRQGLLERSQMTVPDPAALVRRYLRAFGPARAADVTTWSGVTGLGPVLAAMEDLVVREDVDGRRLFDVPGPSSSTRTRPPTASAGWE